MISMTDSGLKSLLGFLLRNKNMAVSLLDQFKPEEIEKGLLSIPENLLNRDIKMLVMDKSAPYLNDYQFLFNQGSIFVDLDVNGKQLGRLKAKYMLTISQFEFHDNIHQIKFSFQEDLKSEGNFMQNMAIKAAGLKGTYLQTAVEMAKLSFIDVKNDTITIDLDALDAMKKVPSTLTVNYLSSQDGLLKLRFHI